MNASATTSPRPLANIRIRGQRKRRLAEQLLRLHRTRPASPARHTGPLAPPLRVVCIADTHNRQPDLPPGDVLIHAGDLTESGSFDEIQAGLTWLSSQPHKHKILVAGNHDVLLDDAFLAKHPARRYGESRTREDLEWGDIIYLQDSSVTLNFTTNEGGNSRSVTIFGSPWTPQYGVSAFQYRPDALDDWEERTALMDRNPDILITHGPPRHHLDQRDFHRAGCPYLAECVYRLRPRLMVFGHIHASYGREDVVLDGVQRAYSEIMTGWSSWGALAWMAILAAWDRLASILGVDLWRDSKVTTFVNAAVVAGPQNELRNPPIVVEI